MVKEKSWTKAEHHYREAIAYLETIEKTKRKEFKDLHKTVLQNLAVVMNN